MAAFQSCSFFGPACMIYTMKVVDLVNVIIYVNSVDNFFHGRKAQWVIIRKEVKL